MFVKAADVFNLSEATRRDLEQHQLRAKVGGSEVNPKFRRLIQSAGSYRQQSQAKWQSFDPQTAQIARRHVYVVETCDWLEEEVMVEIDRVPFGHGALRECFRMKEVSMAWGDGPNRGDSASQVDGLSFGAATPSDCRTPSECGTPHPGGSFHRLAEDSPALGDGTTPVPRVQRTLTQDSIQSGGAESSGKADDEASADGRHHCGGLAFPVTAIKSMKRSDKRRLWVAKRSIKDHGDLGLHLEQCKQDAALQMVAKHYGEAFNAAVRRAEAGSAARPTGTRSVDFLMSHVIGLSDGSTFGAESFVWGNYIKHNNNSGTTFSDRVTPQAFSYFSFVSSSRRLMIVDIQGVDDLYTDPVVHFLPQHCPGLGQTDVNLGLRGFALFFWSHRFNPIDCFLGLPPFALALSEQRALGLRQAGQKLHELHKTLQTSAAGRAARVGAAALRGAAPAARVALADVPGVDLRPEAWSAARLPPPQTPQPAGLPLDLVEAACHLEIADMYSEGRLCEATLFGGAASGAASRRDLEAAVFHLAEAARQGLPAALLGLARLASELSHEDFLPGVSGDAVHRPLVLALLERASERGALDALAVLGLMLAEGPADEARRAAAHLVAFAEDRGGDQADGGDDELDVAKGFDVPSLHGCTLDWEDTHGLQPHGAYAEAAKLYEGTLRSEPGVGGAAAASGRGANASGADRRARRAVARLGA